MYVCVCVPAFKRNRYLSSLTNTMKMSDQLFGEQRRNGWGVMRGPSWMNECNYNRTQCIYMYMYICMHTYVCVCVCVLWSNNGVCRVQQNAWINKNSIWIESSRVGADEGEQQQQRNDILWGICCIWKAKPQSQHHPTPPRIVSYKSMRIHSSKRLQRKCSNYFDLSPQHVGFSNCKFPRLRIGIGTIGCFKADVQKETVKLRMKSYMNTELDFRINPDLITYEERLFSLTLNNDFLNLIQILYFLLTQ